MLMNIIVIIRIILFKSYIKFIDWLFKYTIIMILFSIKKIKMDNNNIINYFILILYKKIIFNIL
jgi:hypothetical protein